MLEFWTNKNENKMAVFRDGQFLAKFTQQELRQIAEFCITNYGDQKPNPKLQINQNKSLFQNKNDAPF